MFASCSFTTIDMKTYKIKNRNGTVHTLIVTNKNTLKFIPSKDTHYMQCSGGEDGLHSIDPDGGPFICLGHTPAQLLHRDLPNRPIVEIKQERTHYTLLLHKEEVIKGRTIIRKKPKNK
jgi:hypothetical protein